MERRLFLVCLTALCFYSSFSQNRSYSDIADSVYMALDKREASFVLPLLDDSCLISSLPRGGNYKMVPLLLDKYPPVHAYKIIGIDKEPAGTRVKLEVMYEAGKAAYPDFLVNRQWRITELNVVKSATLNDHKPAIRALTSPDTLSIPLLIREGHLYIKAEADGRKGLFLLDTGTPDMILNRAYFSDSLKWLSTSIAEAGANSKGEGILVRKVNAFAMGRMKLANFSAMVMNNGAAGGEEGLPFLGSIGYNTIRDFELRFDMAASKLILVKTDREGNYTSQQFRPAAVKFMAPVEMRKYMPVILLTVGDQSFRMGIDAGAAATVLFARNKSAVLPFMSGVNEAMAAQESVPVGGIAGKLSKAIIGSLEFTDMPVVIEGNYLDYNSAGEALPLDGLLGTAFLQYYKTAINFKKKLIYFR